MFSPQQVQDNADTLVKAKGKQVSIEDQNNSPIRNGASDNVMSPKDVEELLRIIKKYDYKVVDQLGQT